MVYAYNSIHYTPRRGRDGHHVLQLQVLRPANQSLILCFAICLYVFDAWLALGAHVVRLCVMCCVAYCCCWLWSCGQPMICFACSVSLLCYLSVAYVYVCVCVYIYIYIYTHIDLVSWSCGQPMNSHCCYMYVFSCYLLSLLLFVFLQPADELFILWICCYLYMHIHVYWFVVCFSAVS